mmetsp:Transcript_1205/g.1083  ORF Transcript_1205/g.1083 Transcript_1205/m.1083 type:complete len:200 (+) Transcript_1205:174-773(+)
MSQISGRSYMDKTNKTHTPRSRITNKLKSLHSKKSDISSRINQKPQHTPKQKLIPKSSLPASLEKSPGKIKSKELKYKLRSSKLDNKSTKTKGSRNNYSKIKTHGISTFDNSKLKQMILCPALGKPTVSSRLRKIKESTINTTARNPNKMSVMTEASPSSKYHTSKKPSVDYYNGVSYKSGQNTKFQKLRKRVAKTFIG